MKWIDEYFSQLQAVLEKVPRDTVQAIAETLLDAQRRDAQVFVLGNGGSASTASHWACDLGKGTAVEGKRRLRLISLTDNNAMMTAWANDTSYNDMFLEQLKNLVNDGDVVVGISASGNSENVLRAMRYAKEHGCTTVGLTGFGGGKLAGMVDIALVADSYDYGQVEDVHLIVNHILRLCIHETLRAPAV
jgi:D-sedoheptulose 7-phosphate isomerase